MLRSSLRLSRWTIRWSSLIGAILSFLSFSSVRADVWGPGDWNGVESAETLPLGVSRLGLESQWEDGPVLSDRVIGSEAWTVGRARYVAGRGPDTEFGVQADLYKKVGSVRGGGSPRFHFKFGLDSQTTQGSSSRWDQAIWLGFKWPTANEPLEWDTGDFGLQYLASYSSKTSYGDFEFRLQTGPLIYGDRESADSQNHTWLAAVGAHFRTPNQRHEVSFDMTRVLSLPGAWYRIWDSETGPWERFTVGMNYAWGDPARQRFLVRGTRQLIEAGTQKSITLGWIWSWCSP